MAVTTPPPEAEAPKIDDYQVAGHVGEITRSATHHMLSVVNTVLLIVLAVISFSLFWVVATLFNIV